MALRRILLPWDSQPLEAAGHDADNPLTQGLVSLVHPMARRDAVRGRLLTLGSSVTLPITSDGPALSGATTNGQVNLNAGGGFGSLVGTGNFSWYGRIFVTSTNTLQYYVYDGDASGQNYGVFFSITAAGAWHFEVVDASAAYGLDGGSVTAGWHDIEFESVQGTSWTAYVDGAQVANYNYGGAARKTGTAAILCAPGLYNSGLGFTGRMSISAFWNRTRSAPERYAVRSAPWRLFEPQQILVPVVAAGGGASITLPSASAAGAAGATTATGGAGTALESAAATASAGTVTATGGAGLTLTGAGAAAQAGTVAATAGGAVTVVGAAATGDAGSITATAGGSASVTLPSAAAASAAGDIGATGGASAVLSGAAAVVAAGNITVSTAGGASVVLSGVACAGQAGLIAAAGGAQILLGSAASAAYAGIVSASAAVPAVSPDPYRTLLITAELRALAIAAETRNLAIPAETRTARITR